MDIKIIAVLIGAVTGAIVTVVGWFVNYKLSREKEDASKRKQARLAYLQRQIEELYGPLYGLIQNSFFVNEVAKGILPTSEAGHILFEQFDHSKNHPQTWRYFVENHFLRLNNRMSGIIYRKLHLLEGGEMPDSFQLFFRHKVQFECLDRLWRERRIENTSIGGDGWPVKFGEDIKNTLDQLNTMYHNYLESAEQI